MRLFQNYGTPRAYRKRLDILARNENTFSARRDIFIEDRYGASHFLKPVLVGDLTAFFTNGDDPVLQRMWACEHGISDTKSLTNILLTQIEEHRTEVFYNLDPMLYGSAFVRRLPSCVKKKICWRAAPSPGADFSAYDLIVCNFPSIIEAWRRQGLRAEYFAPAHDWRMDDFVDAGNPRPIDVVFVGGYSRHHEYRAQVLEEVARLIEKYQVVFHFDRSRLTRLAESPLGLVGPLFKYRRPAQVRKVSAHPVFGLDLYRLLARAKIVLNAAIDMSNTDRGNMRCFEALGCGALMVSDSGKYPFGFEAGENILTYESPLEAVHVIKRALDNWPEAQRIAARGHQMMRSLYNKDQQWTEFARLVGSA